MLLLLIFFQCKILYVIIWVEKLHFNCFLFCIVVSDFLLLEYLKMKRVLKIKVWVLVVKMYWHHRITSYLSVILIFDKSFFLRNWFSNNNHGWLFSSKHITPVEKPWCWSQRINTRGNVHLILLLELKEKLNLADVNLLKVNFQSKATWANTPPPPSTPVAALTRPYAWEYYLVLTEN